MMLEYFTSAFGTVLGVLAAVCVFLLVMWISTSQIDKVECAGHEKVTGAKTEYTAGACYIEIDGEMIRHSHYLLMLENPQ